MKYLIFSDLHGSSESAEIIIEKFKKYECDQMICLGDVLYHGPRNDLPFSYNPKEVIKILNEYAENIICIQGNCDAEVDQMVLNFKLLSSLDKEINGKKCHFEHGHHLDDLKTDAKYIFFGHIHINQIKNVDNKVYINPGSITIPKENTARSFIIFDENTIRIFDIDDNLINKLTF